MESSVEPNACDQEVKELLDALQRLKQELREEISQLSLDEPSSGESTAVADNSVAVSDCNRKLANIDRALENICQQNPGYCVSCSAAIPLHRLQSAPDSLYCAICEAQATKEQ